MILRDLGFSIAHGPDLENVANHSRVCYDRSNPVPRTWPFNEESSTVKILKIKAWYRTIQLQELNGLKELKVLWRDRVILNGPWYLLLPKLTFMRTSSSNWKLSNSGVAKPASERSGRYPALRHLEIDDCQRLSGDLQALEHLELNSQEWRSLPETAGHLQALKILKIYACQKLMYMDLPNVKHLVLDNCSLMPLSDGLERLQALEDLRIYNSSLRAPSNTIGQLKALRHFEISWCHDWRALVDILGESQALRKLVIHRCGDHGCPGTIDQLEFLVSLASRGLLQGSGQVELPRPILDEGGVRIIADDSELLQSVPDDTAIITDCRRLEALPDILERRLGSHANTLITKNCWRLTDLPLSLGRFQGLQRLEVRNCHTLEALPGTIGELQTLRELKTADCHHLQFLPDTIGDMIALQKLWISHCSDLKILPDTIGELQALRHLTIQSCSCLKSLPIYLGNLRALEDLQIQDCPYLEELPNHLHGLRALKYFGIKHCERLRALSEDVGVLLALRHLTIESCESLRSLPDAIGKLHLLECLEVRDCNKLEALPRTLGELSALKQFALEYCEGLYTLPDALGKLPSKLEDKFADTNLQ